MASESKVGDVQNMSSARDIADVFAGPEIGWVTCNLKGACRLLASLIGREREAAREMREVLGLCLPCIDEEIHDPRTLVDRRDSLTVLRRRVARLIGGGE